ncbi:MAG: SpoIIE family protein phosphatase [Bacteroidales bacterium]|nr:SpoIIE family protein phosphatase [Bacteroidales bacterium]
MDRRKIIIVQLVMLFIFINCNSVFASEYNTNLLNINILGNNSILFLVILLLIGVFFIIKLLNNNKLINNEILKQQDIIKEKQNIITQKTKTIKEISEAFSETKEDLKSSIYYAERIQRAVIPQKSEIKNLFTNSFVYFSPRDIVSGDFYTCTQTTNYKIIIVADCTGHGIPGGFLSMLGLSALKDLLSKRILTNNINPGEILNALRHFIITSFAEETDDNNTTISDGMDITFCAFNNEMTQLKYATADHTIYVFRDGEIQKLKGNRMPIGRHPKQDTPFETFTFDLKKNDMVYLCSDGIQDQFGGENDVKFMTKRLVQMLQDVGNESIDNQYQTISKIVDDWKLGKNQFDDQTLIGIRI